MKQRAVLSMFALLPRESQDALLSAGGLATDTVTARPRPSGVIHLERYFAFAGMPDQLRNVVRIVLPALLNDFDRVGPLEQHGMSDAPWQIELSRQLSDAGLDLFNAMSASWSAELKNRGFVMSKYLLQVETMTAAAGRGDDSASRFIEIVRRDYPLAAGVQMLVPADLLDNMARAKAAELCQIR
jgi:hypothetical protein